MKISALLILQTCLLCVTFAQLPYQNLPYTRQIKSATYNQPPSINSLLSSCSSNVPFMDKIGAIAAVIQKMPPKNPGNNNKRLYMAEALKKTALESLMLAANACKCSPKAVNGAPLPAPQVTVERRSEIIVNRPVNVRYV